MQKAEIPYNRHYVPSLADTMQWVLDDIPTALMQQGCRKILLVGYPSDYQAPDMLKANLPVIDLLPLDVADAEASVTNKTPLSIETIPEDISQEYDGIGIAFPFSRAQDPVAMVAQYAMKLQINSGKIVVGDINRATLANLEWYLGGNWFMPALPQSIPGTRNCCDLAIMVASMVNQRLEMKRIQFDGWYEHLLQWQNQGAPLIFPMRLGDVVFPSPAIAMMSFFLTVYITYQRSKYVEEQVPNLKPEYFTGKIRRNVIPK